MLGIPSPDRQACDDNDYQRKKLDGEVITQISTDTVDTYFHEPDRWHHALSLFPGIVMCCVFKLMMTLRLQAFQQTHTGSKASINF